MWKESPGLSRVSTSSSPSPPVWKSISPERTWMVSSLRWWYWRLRAWPLLMCKVFPTYRPVWALISSYPQGVSTRTGLVAGMSVRGHHDCGGAQLALDVRAVPAGRLCVAEGSHPDAVPGPLGSEGGLDHV